MGHMSSESDFDQEYDVDEIAKQIVEWHKQDLEDKNKNKTRRHNQ